MTSDPDVKVKTFFKIEYRKNGASQGQKLTNRKLRVARVS